MTEQSALSLLVIVALGPLVVEAAHGTLATMSATITNNDSADCSVTRFYTMNNGVWAFNSHSVSPMSTNGVYSPGETETHTFTVSTASLPIPQGQTTDSYVTAISVKRQYSSVTHLSNEAVVYVSPPR